jgi:hypothetical protein
MRTIEAACVCVMLAACANEVHLPGRDAPDDAGSHGGADARADADTPAPSPDAATTPDSGPDVPPDSGEMEPACEVAAPNANLTGVTPQGSLQMDYVFIGDVLNGGHDCYPFRLMFSSDPALPADSTLDVIGTGNLLTGEPVPAGIHLRTPAGELDTAGTVTFAAYDSGAITASGEVSIMGPDWMVSGTFSGEACGLLADTCI